MGNKSSSSQSERSEETTREQPSYWQMATQGYQELVNAIIRPPRSRYTVRNLGPKCFEFCERTYIRSDFALTNPRGLSIVCSHWEPSEICRNSRILPCVIYMHGNSSSRLESLPQLSTVLSLGATFFAFDFAGSGCSEGDYVSLGAFEKDDLQTAIDYLRSTGSTSMIALWGRSMGAATALLHGERDPSIAAMVLDSPFSDLETLAEEMVEKGRKHGLFAPDLIVKIAMRFIRSSVEKAADFDIKTLAPIDHADRCFIPALFVAAENDDFIPPHHSKQIYEKYSGDKNMIIVEGDHNSPRPRFMYESTSIFLTQALQVSEDLICDEGQAFPGALPWNTQRIMRRSGSGSSLNSVRRGGDYTHPSSPKQRIRNNGSLERMRRSDSREAVDNGSGSDAESSSTSPSISRVRSYSLTANESAAESEVEIGMTSVRQADIRSKLYRLLGDTSGAVALSHSSTSSSASSVPVKGSQREVDEYLAAKHGLEDSDKDAEDRSVAFASSSREDSIISGKIVSASAHFRGSPLVMREAHSHYHERATLKSPGVASGVTTRQLPPLPQPLPPSADATLPTDISLSFQGQNDSEVAEDSAWRCHVCTLVNTSVELYCDACGVSRY